MSFTSQHLCGQIMQLGYFSEGEAVYAPSHSGVSSYGRRGARLPGRFSGSPSVIDGEPLRTHHWELRAPAALIWISTAIATICLPTTHAWAHVKWFAPYDVTQSPAIAGDVLTRHFVLIFAAFTSLLIASFLLDGLAGRWGRLLTTTGKLEDLEERLLRSGTGAFFMALFATGGVILTPELRTGADWAIWLQFGIAVSMLSQRTCLLGGLGILGLYGFGIVQYGYFHLADYPMFLGLSAYLALTSATSERLRAQRMLILHVSICVTLMWGAVEKWAYPQWTFPLLAERPYLTFGLSPELFMMVAGFVEFTFAFYILTGFGLLRLAILGLGSIFAAAILDFGKIDAIGHMPILVAMAAMFLHGPTALNLWLHRQPVSSLNRARTAGTAFATSVFLFLGLYYVLQYAEYGHGPHDHKVAVSHAVVGTL
jgi:hypothetical protein